MEYAEMGSVMTYDWESTRYVSPITGGVIPEAQSSRYFAGLLAGLEHLHSQLIVHRDLKPEVKFLDYI